MARNYATSADYQSYTGQTPPADIEARLGRASRFLDSDVFRLCWYEVDEDGYPSNAVVRQAFADAVCAQVQWWAETGDELGVAGRWDSVKLGSLSLSRGSSSGSSSGSASSGREVAETAMEVLRSPDLTPEIFVLGLVVQC
ncbi:hypothetical protein [Streptomyces sp. NBC_00258]|uniref:hypothetical protein n=1 Tax=Streptomyces sp. NBC_00258 TaxID=2903642 RepID=UPI002E2A7D14|nr:hypothetical protein [Streptomyces sp. NBC_00258]